MLSGVIPAPLKPGEGATTGEEAAAAMAYAGVAAEADTHTASTPAAADSK